MSDQLSAIIFDSGIGGLSILRELLESQDYLRLAYLADQAKFPYGNRDQEWIEHRLQQVVAWVATLNPRAFIIACNSATVNSVKSLRKSFNFPIIGIEPVVKPLSKFSSSLLLATSTTLESPNTQTLIKHYKPSNMVSFTPEFLTVAIEDMDQKQISQSLFNLKQQFSSPQAIGLSCTHYPLAKDEIQQAFPESVIVDPSAAIAKRLTTLIEPDNEDSTKTQVDWFTTGEVVKLSEQVNHYFDQRIIAKQVNI